jgi:hypothetical protein
MVPSGEALPPMVHLTPVADDPTPAARPGLPEPRGPVSERVLEALRGRPGWVGPQPPIADDPCGEDAQLALYCCLELRYQGFAGVDPQWEVEPGLAEARNALGEAYVERVKEDVGPVDGGTPYEVCAQLVALAGGDQDDGGGDSDDSDDGPSLSAWLDACGTLDQLREFAIHRSAYQLKEADPHTYALPRLPAGRAKAAYVEIQTDEYGEGEPGAAHQELFAATLRALGLDDRYGAYLDRLPAPTLATVNLLSWFGTSRRWLGACVGHLALFEMTSVGPMGRYAAAVRRLTGGDAGAEFYDVHVEADEHHQRLAVDGLVRPLVAEEPGLAADVVFGARALSVVEGRLTAHLLDSWAAGRTSLRVSGAPGPTAAAGPPTPAASAATPALGRTGRG